MKIIQAKLYHVKIPFSKTINHNLKKRNSSEAIIVALQDTNGNIGYGEGAPRNYVTRFSAKEVIQRAKPALTCCLKQNFHTPSDVDFFCKALRVWIETPSLIAAIEMALLDLLGRNRNVSIGHFLQQEDLNIPCYSGVLPFVSLAKLPQWLNLIEQLELKHLKVKVGRPQDEQILKRVRERLGPKLDIRLDANRAWSVKEAITRINQLKKYDISGIEEPLIGEQIAFLPHVLKQTQVPLILDESVYTLDQANYFANLIPAKQLLFNLKISKSSGLLGAAEIYQFATSRGIECQLGCNVGETAILSAAGRQFAQSYHLKYLEGSYASFFMSDDIAQTPINFSRGGKAMLLDQPGLGIHINSKKLERYSVESLMVRENHSIPLSNKLLEN